MLQMLHRSHQGIVQTKAIARSYTWWPGMASAIEATVSGSSACKSVRQMPPKVPEHPWLDEKIKPWSRLHIDFAGPFQGKYLFVANDPASKRTEANIVPTVSTLAVTTCLREIFETHSLPRLLTLRNQTPVYAAVSF
ncbi:hypothetical protein M514_11419, partial [Trichuris suis]